MANLLEAYKKRLNVAERYYSKSHNGEALGESKKLIIAKTLESTNKFLNEAFDNSVGTQRSDMGMFKKFAMNLVNCALPNLIAFDLVIVYPMSSMSGYVNYIEYVAGSAKGATAVGDVFNNPFQLGKVDPTYTSSRVAETKNFAEATTSIALNWNPVVPGTVAFDVTDDSSDATVTHFVDDGAGKIYSYEDGAEVSIVETLVTDAVGANGHLEGVAPRIVKTITGATQAGTIVYGNTATKGVSSTGAEQIYTAGTATITLTTGVTGSITFNYQYNNVAIPQNDLPMVAAQMRAIPLIAKARRVAVYYSQIAAYQAKTDYGFDLGQQLAEKAVGQLSYEIDTEIVKLLDTTAGDAQASLTWGKNQPVGISKAEHYEGFAELVGIAKDIIYNRTQRWAPNYMIISSSILPILTFLRGFKAAPAGKINGPYMAGTLDGLKVFVSPAMARGRFVIGVNGDDMMSSVAVYAPYMPIVPTQLLQYADGGNSQGWSTLYALEVLNANLIVAGQVNDVVDYNTYVGGVVTNTVGGGRA